MENIEERVRALELQLALWKGAFIVATIAIFASLGITAYVSLPREVNRQVAEKVGVETLARVKQLNDEISSIDSNSEAAAKKLGIPEIKSELAKKAALGTSYRLRTNTNTPLDAAAREGNNSGHGTPVTLGTTDKGGAGFLWSLVPQ